MDDEAKERQAKRSRAYYERNKDLVMQRSAEWAKSHPEQRAEIYRRRDDRYRAANNEKARNRKRAQYHADIVESRWRLKAKSATHRARALGLLVEKVDYRVVAERDRWICHICQVSVSPDDVEFDHIVPISRGGSHTYGNVAVVHPACNRRKGTRLLEELKEIRA